EEYDPATDHWTSRAPLGTARGALAVAAAPNGKVYAVGGETAACSAYHRCATVEEDDPAAGHWTTKAPMPTPRDQLGLAVAPNGRLYAVGGYVSTPSGQGVVETVEEYDPIADIWAAAPALSTQYTARFALGLATGANGRLYAIGGRNGSVYFASALE